jgi:hypothetical protein
MSDPFGINKKDHTASNAVYTGAGATTAGVGLAGGGIPGASGNLSGLARQKENKGKDLPRGQRVANAVSAPTKAYKGGILGFRIGAHEGGNYDFKQKATLGEWHPSDIPHKAFVQGRHRGKVAPEETIIRQMKGGKKVASAAVVAGGAAAAYGQRDKIKAKFGKADKWDKRSGTALGAGGAGLAVTGGVGGLLGHQEKHWNREAAKSQGAAAKLVPGLAGKTDMDIARNKQIFDGVDPKVARAAGHLRGAAAQQHHFGEAYHITGRSLASRPYP